MSDTQEGKLTLPPEEKLKNFSITLTLDTIAWLHKRYPRKGSVKIRELVEDAKRREDAAARKATKSPGAMQDTGEKG